MGSNSIEILSRACVLDQRLTMKSILYKHNCYMNFLPSHTLTKVAPNLRQHRRALLQEILAQDIGVPSRSLPDWPGLKRILEVYLLPELGTFIEAHTKYRYEQSLRSHMTRGEATQEDRVPQQVVLSFISDVIRNVVPRGFVGHNTAGLGRLARGIVKGCPPLTVRHLTRFMPGSLETSWLRKVPDVVSRVHLALKLILWLAADYVPSVLCAVLYATKFDSAKIAPLFYIKPVWQSLQRRALNDLLERGSLTRLPCEVQHGCGKLRFVPKKVGMRPIVIVRAGEPEKQTMVRRSKMLMRHLNPQPLRIAQHWEKFQKRVLEQRATGDEGRVLFVRTDVRNAYGTVRQDKVLEILDAHMSALPSQVQVEETPLVPWAVQRVVRQKDAIPGSSKETTTPRTSQIKPRMIAISREGAHRLLTQAVTRQEVRFGKRMFQLKRGLAQGAPLSSCLCTMALEHLYATHLTQFNDECSMVWRVVDDFLLVTLCPATAQRFKELVLEGFPDYGWYMNASKTTDNISDPTNSSVTFNGALFDFKTLEVMADFSHHSPETVIYSLNLRMNVPEIENFERLLGNPMALKLEQLFLSLRTNRLKTVLLHLGAVAKLHALRFRAMARYLFPHEAQCNDRCKLLISSYLRADGRLSGHVRNLMGQEEQPRITAALVKWMLNKAVLRRSAGFLCSVARKIIASQTHTFETQISPDLMSLCYQVHDMQGPCDPKVH